MPDHIHFILWLNGLAEQAPTMGIVVGGGVRGWVVCRRPGGDRRALPGHQSDKRSTLDLAVAVGGIIARCSLATSAFRIGSRGRPGGDHRSLPGHHSDKRSTLDLAV